MKNLENIVITFEGPADERDVYSRIKQPAPLPNGSMQRQIALAVSNISLRDLVEHFFSAAGFASTLIEGKAALIASAAIVAALDLLAICSFPDEYAEILELLEKTPRGSSLKWSAIRALAPTNTVPSIDEVLDLLVKEGFLARKRDGSLIVMKRPLLRCQVDFC